MKKVVSKFDILQNMNEWCQKNRCFIWILPAVFAIGVIWVTRFVTVTGLPRQSCRGMENDSLPQYSPVESSRIIRDPNLAGMLRVSDEILVTYRSGVSLDELCMILGSLNLTMVAHIPETHDLQVRIPEGSTTADIRALITALEADGRIARANFHYALDE